jgi:hypothetical protein
MPDRLRVGLAAGVGGVLLAALAGCSALLGPAATPATPVHPAPSYPVPVLTVATPKPRSAAPALRTTGVAWPAVLASLSGYGQWLLANPDPALIGNVAMPGCSMYNLISRQATALLRDQAYLQPAAPVFGPVTGPSPAPGATAAVLGNEVTLDVTATRPLEAVLSRAGGTPISSFDALPQTTLQITLFRPADNKWRFCTVNAAADTGAGDDPPVPLL